jgi:hypothetical protein
MSADDRDSGAAQLLGNGGKIEPYNHVIAFVRKQLGRTQDYRKRA